jgi:hypothetical protein
MDSMERTDAGNVHGGMPSTVAMQTVVWKARSHNANLVVIQWEGVGFLKLI